MAKENIEKKVAAYFKQNQSRGVVYTTSDGFLFERKENANTHAKTQKDYNVETFTKSVEAKGVKESKDSKGPKVVKFNDADVELKKAIETYNSVEGVKALNKNTGVKKVQEAIDSLEEEGKKAFESSLTPRVK